MTDIGGIKILIIDDNEPSATSLGWMLELAGHQTRRALDGLSGVKIAREFRPDVILLDIGMPAMNGYQVCSLLRRDPAMAATVFIAQTGWGQREHRERSRQAGFDHHLVKPVQWQQLQEIIHGLVKPGAALAAEG